MSVHEEKTSRRWLSSPAGIVLLLFFPLGGIVFFTYLIFNRPDIFLNICREDGIIESLQCAIFLLSALFAGYLAFYSFQPGRLTAVGIFGLIAVSLFLIAMEEISWGQRLLNIETPEALRNINLQKEINLHNITFFQRMIFPAYILMGGAGLSAAMICFFTPRRCRIFRFPSLFPALIFLFLPALIYGIYRITAGDWSRLRRVYPFSTAKLISAVQEPVELFLAVGIFFLLVGARQNQRVRRKGTGSRAQGQTPPSAGRIDF